MHRADGHAARCKKSCEVPLKFAGAAPKTNSAEGDRKSTRLNSSHGYISYAVFCLKKNRPYTKESLLSREVEVFAGEEEEEGTQVETPATDDIEEGMHAVEDEGEAIDFSNEADGDSEDEDEDES